MKKRTLGVNGPEVSTIGLGCMGMSAFYGATDEPESVRTIHRALDLGCNFLDTSDMYGPHTNERLVGGAIAGRRDDSHSPGRDGKRAAAKPLRIPIDAASVDGLAAVDDDGRAVDEGRGVRQKEGGDPRKQPKKKQQAANKFEHSGEAINGQKGQLIEHFDVRHVQQLRSTVLKVKIRGNQAQSQMLTNASSEKRETRPRSRSLIRGWVTPQRLAASACVHAFCFRRAAIFCISSARARRFAACSGVSAMASQTLA